MDAAEDIVTKKIRNIPFDDLVENLSKEAQLKNYRITKVVNIDNVKNRVGLVKGLEIKFRHYKIVEICNLTNCNDVVSSDFRAGVFMPVRFAVYQPLDDTAVYVSYLKPTSFARLFDSEKVTVTARIIEDDMKHVVAAADF